MAGRLRSCKASEFEIGELFEKLIKGLRQEMSGVLEDIERSRNLSLEDMKGLLKVVGNQKVGGSGMCQSVQICLRPWRSMFFSLSTLLSSLILCISVSAPVKQNE